MTKTIEGCKKALYGLSTVDLYSTVFIFARKRNNVFNKNKRNIVNKII